MTDDNITEFKTPGVIVHNYEDNPEFYDTLRDESLDAWKTIYNNLRAKNLVDNDIQALSGLISCSIQFMTMSMGHARTIELLEEHSRRLRTAKDGEIM